MQNTSSPIVIRDDLLAELPLRVFNYRQPDDIAHSHDFCELVLVRRGRGVHLTGSGEQPIASGDVLHIAPGTVHTYGNVEELEIANILYLPEKLGFAAGDLAATEGYQMLFPPRGRFGEPEAGRVTLTDSGRRKAENLVAAMLIEQSHRDAGYLFHMKLHFMALFALACREVEGEGKHGAGEDEAERLAVLVDYLEKSYKEPVTLALLARLGGRSPCSLIRMFRRAFDTTPLGYLQEFRLRRAEELLKGTKMPVSEVAAECGYPDSNYFAKLFREKRGVAPRVWRKDGGRNTG